MEAMETQKLEQIFQQLLPDDIDIVADFASYILEKRMRGKKDLDQVFDRISEIIAKSPPNPHPVFASVDDIYEMTEWGETDIQKQRANLKKISGIFTSTKGPNNVSEDIDSYLYD